MNRYIVGSGYIAKHPGADEFALMWAKNLQDNEDFKPQATYIICARGDYPAQYSGDFHFIRLTGNLGHIWTIQRDEMNFRLEGWPAALMALAFIAYNDESDLLFIEQDCLPFGNFVSQLYSEIRDGVGCIMGNVSVQPCAQSLMLIRHWFIPELVHGYLGKKIHDNKLQGEQAFEQMEKEMVGKFQRFSFGFDRDRPPNGFESMKGKPWYVQQTSVDEQARLKQLGFIS